MRKYLRITMNRALIAYQYRFNALSKIFIVFLQFIVVYFLWKNIYKSSGKEFIGTYSQNEMLIYILITNFTNYVYGFDNIHRLGGLVRTGKLNSLLIQPISLIKENFFNYLGNKIVIFTVFILLVIIANIKYTFLSILLIFTTFIMYFYLTAAVSVLGFWLLEVWPLHGLLNGMFYILAGIYFPLDLIPERIYNIIQYNPFSLVVYALAKTLQGKNEPKQILLYILASIIWSLIFRIIFIIYLKKGLKIYEGAGA